MAENITLNEENKALSLPIEILIIDQKEAF